MLEVLLGAPQLFVVLAVQRELLQPTSLQQPLLFFLLGLQQFLLLQFDQLRRYAVRSGLRAQKQVPQFAHEFFGILRVQKAGQIDLHLATVGRFRLLQLVVSELGDHLILDAWRVQIWKFSSSKHVEVNKQANKRVQVNASE